MHADLLDIARASEVSHALTSNLLPRGSAVLVACSGGADSTALAVAACARAEDLGVRIVVGHVDHALRTESHHDAERVRVLAQDLQVSFCSVRLPPLTAEIRALGLEGAAREARYAALAG
ncbi:MAG: ATP-binding protein, partial [Myxococcales bacterium]